MVQRTSKPSKQQPVAMAPDGALAGDLIWHVGNIGKFLGRTPRQVYHMIEKQRLPVCRVGRTICARKSELAAFLSANAKGKRS